MTTSPAVAVPLPHIPRRGPAAPAPTAPAAGGAGTVPLAARCGWVLHRALAAVAAPLTDPDPPRPGPDRGARVHPVPTGTTPGTRTGARPAASPRPATGRELRAALAGLPVLLVGGLASSPQSLHPLRDALAAVGARPVVAPVGLGLDCGERTVHRVADALAELADGAGRPAAVVAHSRGGHFARAVAVRHPEQVTALVTLGSPVNRLLGVHPLLRAEAWVLGAAGTLGVPGLLRIACLYGGCCRQLRDDLLQPVPQQVHYVSVFSRSDRVVDWRSCLDPAATHREVTASHSGLLREPDVLRLVLAELAAAGPRSPDPAAAPAAARLGHLVAAA